MLRQLNHDEEQRMHALDRLLFHLDTSQDNVLSQITSLTSKILNMPSALITVSDTHSLHIKAKHNFVLNEMRKVGALDQYTMQTNELLVCNDASQDERFKNSPYVSGEPHIRFYAGIPLITKAGYAIGTLSVVDYVARSFSKMQRRDLKTLASITMALIEYRNAIGLIDAVTLLPNRQRLIEDISQSTDIFEDFVLILLDSIDLTYIYEMARSLGMPTVESVLKDIGLFLRLNISRQASIYSISAGRFALLVKKEQQEQILGTLMSCADRIQQSITSHIPLKLEIFIGYTEFQIPIDDPQRILREAWSALHDALKKNTRLMAYHKESDEYQKRAFTLLNDLSDTLQHGHPGLYLVYQPKLHIKTRRVIGAEALIRWRHPEFGEIYPDQFIPLAEDTTLMRPLTEWVIQQAARQVRKWRQVSINISVSVNVTVTNFAEEDLIERLQRILRTNELSIHDIEFECLETQKIVENSAALSTIKKLKDQGFMISLDDFGTGYSNLNYLKNTPAHVIKLDKSLIKDMKTDKSSRIIVQHTIEMLHKLNYLVLAEGIEDEETLDYLGHYNCDQGQGYYFSRPLVADNFARWLALHDASIKL